MESRLSAKPIAAFLIAALLSAAVSVADPVSPSTAPATRPALDPARRAKAEQYMKLAEAGQDDSDQSVFARAYLALAQAQLGDVPGAFRQIARIKDAEEAACATLQIADDQFRDQIAVALVKSLGPAADLSWIAKLLAPARTLAYADAARTMLEPADDEGRN